MMARILVLVAALAFVSPVFAAKRKTASHPDTTNQPLAERLGGYKGITKVVDAFVAKCAADPRINTFFAETAKDKKRLAKFKKNLSDQICEAGGGFWDTKGKKPCKYTGKDMKTAHAGMGIKGEQFDALVEDLTATLDSFKVPEKEKNELVAALAPMKGGIVEEGGQTATTNP